MGGAPRGDYVQDKVRPQSDREGGLGHERYIATEHMDVRRDCVRLALSPQRAWTFHLRPGRPTHRAVIILSADITIWEFTFEKADCINSTALDRSL